MILNIIKEINVLLGSSPRRAIFRVIDHTGVIAFYKTRAPYSTLVYDDDVGTVPEYSKVSMHSLNNSTGDYFVCGMFDRFIH